MAMFTRWLEAVSERTSPLALTCVFVSVLVPSIILLYTGTYNIWFHGVFLAVVVLCYGALLLHAAGLKARLARRERELVAESEDLNIPRTAKNRSARAASVGHRRAAST